MPPEQGSNSGIKIPQKDIVKFIIKETLQKRKAMSQKELAQIIASQLKKGDSKYRITGKRAREIAIEIPVKVVIETKKGRMPKRCPCCGHNLKKVYSKNLAGRKILTSLSCTRCSYRGREGKWVPAKYIFMMP